MVKVVEPPKSAANFRGFGEAFLGKKFYPKQAEALEALNPLGSMVSFAACNAGGKTTHVIPAAVMAHLTLCKGKVLMTSGSFRQIKDQLMPSLKALAPMFPGYRFLDTTIQTRDPECFMSAFSTNDAGRFEGQHGDANHPLLIIVDEAKTVRDTIYQAVDRCRPPSQYCRILFASSCGFAQGEFYRSQTIRAGTLTHKPIRLRADECPHISKEEIAATRLKWGNEHPLVKSMLDCEFMEFVEGAAVQLDALDECLANPPMFESGQRKARCDFAWSESAAGDENVLALRNGNRVTLEACFRAKGQFEVCGRFIHEFIRLGLKPFEIEGDGGGEGMKIIEQLGRMGWPITPIFNGQKPIWNENYKNRASEEWCDFAQAIINRQVVLPDDTDLYGQLLNRRIVPTNDGKLCIESKQAMKDPNRKGGSAPSPDRAEAVAGAWARSNALTSVNLVEHRVPNNLPDWARPVDADTVIAEQEGGRRYFD